MDRPSPDDPERPADHFPNEAAPQRDCGNRSQHARTLIGTGYRRGCCLDGRRSARCGLRIRDRHETVRALIQRRYYLAKSSATWINRSLASTSPIETRTPSGANARTDNARASQAAAKAWAFSPSGSHTKFDSVCGGLSPSASSASHTRRRSVTTFSVLAKTSSKSDSDAYAAADAIIEVANGGLMTFRGCEIPAGATE